MEREGLPEELRQIVMRCLEKDPADRFGSAKELARALSRVDLPEEESVVEPVVSAASAGEESSEVGHTALAFPGLELEEPVSSVEVDAEPPGVEEVDAEPPDVEDDVEVEESDAADPKRDSGAMQLLVESSPKSARATQISYSTEELAEGGQNKKGLIILAVLLLFGVAGAGTIAMLLASSDSSEEEVGAVSEQVQAEARPARGGASTPKVADGEEVAPAVTKEQAIDEVDGEEEQPLAMDEAEEDDEAEEESAQRGGALEEPSKSAERERSAGRAETGTGRGAAGAAGAAGGGRPAQREVKRDEGPASLSIGRRQRSTSEAKQEPEAAPPTGLSLQRRRRSGDDEKAATKDEEREQPSRLSIPQRR